MAKISGIYVEIKGDASQLKKELREAKDLVTQQAQGMSNALNNALSPAQLKNSLNGLVRNLNTLSTASKLTGREFGTMSADLGALRRVTGLSEAEFGRLQARMLQTSAAKSQERALRGIAKAAGLSAVEVERLGRQMGVSKASIAAVNSAAAPAASSINMMGAALHAALAYMSVQTVFQFGKAILDAGIALDSLRRSFVAITGSQAGAAEMMSWLRDEAGRLGQNFYELAPAFKSLSAAARGTTLEGEETRKIFSAVTAASTALGLSADQTKGTLLALEQMISKGVVSMEELRRQLGDRLPGAFGMAARAMGVSTQELNKMVAEGKVMADDLLPKLAAELEKTYGKAAQTAALESAQSAVNRLSQEWTDLKNNMFEADTAVAGINMMTEALRGMNEMVTAIRTGRNSAGEVRTIFDGFGRGDMTGVEGYSTYRGKVTPADSLSRIRVADPRITGDQFIKMQSGMEQAAQRSAAYTKEIDKGRKALTKYIQTAREKAKADYDEAMKFVGTAEERNRVLQQYQDALDAIDRRESDAIRKSKKQALADALVRNALDPYQITQLESMNRGDMFYGKAEADKRGLDMLKSQAQENLQLQTEFADKFKAIVLGETEFKLAQIDAQADAYRKAGADEVAIRQWVEAEKLKASRDWESGAIRGLTAYADAAMDTARSIEDLVSGSFKGMEDALVGFVTTGKMEFEDFANSIISDMARIAIQQAITGPLAQAAGGFLSGLLAGPSSAAGSVGGGFNYAGEMSSFFSVNAKGNVFDSSGLHAFANSIVDKPTVFPFAKGVGLMGEAGPEAIMPLKRGPDGSLGVQGGGSNVVVNIIESPGNGGQQQQRQDGDTTIIDVMVEQIESKIAANTMRRQGSLYNANRSVFGLTGQPGVY